MIVFIIRVQIISNTHLLNFPVPAKELIDGLTISNDLKTCFYQIQRPGPRLLKLKIRGKPLLRPHLPPRLLELGYGCLSYFENQIKANVDRQVNSYQTPVNYSAAGRTLRRGISLFLVIFSFRLYDAREKSSKYRVFFSSLFPPKKLKYGKPRLGESTLA